ncbi:MAG: hypothetical protein R3D02_16410 [Hyphomicrobiales bacterium]
MDDPRRVFEQLVDCRDHVGALAGQPRAEHHRVDETHRRGVIADRPRQRVGMCRTVPLAGFLDNPVLFNKGGRVFSIALSISPTVTVAAISS